MEDLINEIIDKVEFKNPSVGEEDTCNMRIYISAHKIAKKHGLNTEKLNVPDWVHQEKYY